MKAEDLRMVLQHLMPHLGTGAPFEIAVVARSIHDEFAAQKNKVPVGRIAAVVRALIFGGLDTTAKQVGLDALIAIAMGVLLAAWSRETQSAVDDDARGRLLSWFAGAESGEGVATG